jgi:GH25 family lysozyme M1 (1,4-beta-N-acetylmuramidase)
VGLYRIASYTGDPNNNTANIGQWPFAAMQQWTDAQNVPGISGNVDGDVFFGDSNAFQQYGYHTQTAMP